MLLENAYFLTAQGGRKYQEDTAYPDSPSATSLLSNKTWIVCDGMGGISGGRIASTTACRIAADWLQTNGEQLTKENAAEACRSLSRQLKAELRIEADIHELPHAMGTTLVGTYLQEKGAWVLHCGDSRLYHLRAGWVRYCTRDHSLVNMLVDEGSITQEQAATHARKHVLARAVSAHSETGSKIDANYLSDLQSGDWLLLCSDGIYGAFSEKAWFETLRQYAGQPQAFLGAVAAEAEAIKGDNYTAWLLVVK